MSDSEKRGAVIDYMRRNNLSPQKMAEKLGAVIRPVALSRWLIGSAEIQPEKTVQILNFCGISSEN